MAASSPVPNVKVGDPVTTFTTVNGNTMPQRPSFHDTPKQNLRGLNKPKCIKCGNVARSRCPFQSCKSCCSKAENPCYIHVLKQSSILPEKLPSFSTASTEQPSTEAPSTGTSWRLSSLRQLSTTFVNSLRAKRPLTRKDAVNINKWRLSKLKEHIRGDTEAEDEAFERYLRNVTLLEEVFSVEGPALDDHPSEDDISKLVTTVKLNLKSDTLKAERFREKMRSLVDQNLRKLRESGLDNDEASVDADELGDPRVPKRAKVGEWRAEKAEALNDLVDRLSKARSEDDLKSCLDLKLQLFNQHESKVSGGMLVQKKRLESMPALLSYSRPQALSIVPLDEATLSGINEGFSSIDQIAEL